MSSPVRKCGNPDQPYDVAVIGLGYIGLPTAAMFAGAGCLVAGVDISERAVKSVNSGELHFEEEGLSELVSRCVQSGALRAYLEPVRARNFIIAVPTPVDHATHEPDISHVMAAGRSIASVLEKGNLVILESTSPVGTTRRLATLLANLRPDLKFPVEGEDNPDVHFAYCPERIIPGRILEELVNNDRIIGGMTSSCTRQAKALYQKLVKGACHETDDRTAELCKLVENSYRDVNIAFANELSMICGDIGLDPWKVIELANHHPRVNILNPGPGVGGHCIAVDPWFIVSVAPDRARLIRTAREVNDEKPRYVIEKINEAMELHCGNAKIACLGLTYKADADDFRESPALYVAKILTKRYPGRVICTDPFHHALRHMGIGNDLEIVQDTMDAIKNADIVVMLVGHSRYREISRPKDKVVVDTIGFWK